MRQTTKAKRNDVPAAAEHGFYGTYRAQSEHWGKLKSEFIDAVHLASLREPWIGTRFAYCKPSGPNVWGILAYVSEGQDAPDGFELVTPERIPLGTKQDIRRWFDRFSGRLPVYPQEPTSAR